MSDLTQVQEEILNQLSQNPIHRGMIRRAVKLNTEGLRVTTKSFNAQLDYLVDEGFIEKHDENYYSIDEKSEVLFQ